MRFKTSIFDKVKTGFLRGNGRVTVEPAWQLKKTETIYGNSIRGPYRYFQDQADSGIQYEIPNIRSIQWNRSDNEDIASCTIEMYNMWHDGNNQMSRLEDQLGRPGYFWPKHGEGNNVWNQQPGKGAFKKNGEWDPNFSWSDVIVPHALLRTYEGYGGQHNDGTFEFQSIDEALFVEGLVITGVWLVDTVTGTADGGLSINCRDVGRLLLDQMVFPPLIPPALYPLEYYPEGKSAFDSYWGPKSKYGDPLGAKGEVKLKYYASSVNGTVGGHHPGHIVDGNWDTFGWTAGHEGPNSAVTPEWFAFSFTESFNSLQMKPWAGGYTCYISINPGGGWMNPNTALVPGTSIPYVKKVNIPLGIPDGHEELVEFEVLDGFDTVTDELGISTQVPKMVNPDGTGVIWLSFQNLYYSELDTGGGPYRAGLRELTAYKSSIKATMYSPAYENLNWAYSIAAHPTRGYWVVDGGGTVHGFGDAANFDTSSGHATIPMGEILGRPGSFYQSVGIAAKEDGKGYWVLDNSGTVHGRGSVGDPGQYTSPGASNGYFHIYPGGHFSADPRIPPVDIGVDITPTHTGGGYWVLYSNGHIRGFGDAEPKYIELPTSAIVTFMTNLMHGSVPGLTSDILRRNLKGRGIVAHPNKMGFWACNGFGEVWTSDQLTGGNVGIEDYGGLVNLEYHKGLADHFKLGPKEYVTGMEVTNHGDGYWLTTGSGKVAAFGEAVNQGPVDIYGGIKPSPNPVIDLQAIFRVLVHGLARDPDGNGFWVLTADGKVHPYNAEFWGQPGHSGRTGYRWHAGNFDGDYTTIVKEILLWAGFTFYDPAIGSGAPAVYGNLESTGIKTDIEIKDKFDKKMLIDVIKELAEVVAYDFRIREDGSAEFSSPNIWRAGNFDENGTRIYVTYDENGTPVWAEPDAPGAEPFIPIIEERTDLFNYSVTLDGDSMRSEIIIGTDLPNPDDPSATRFVRKIPPSATEKYGTAPALRNIEKPAMWISQLFDNPEEMRLMAELIAIRMWFAERTGAASCVANPCLSVGDQVRLVERNTNETYIHLIKGINSNLDNETGVWTYDLTTNWLGNADNWVITAADAVMPYQYIKVSETVDRWQDTTQRGLPTGGTGQSADKDIVEFRGEFHKKTLLMPWSVSVEPDPEVSPELPVPDPGVSGPVSGPGDDQWVFAGTLKVNTRVENAFLRTDIISPTLGDPRGDPKIYIAIFPIGGGSNVAYEIIGQQGKSITLPILGAANTTTEYGFIVQSTPKAVGNATLRLTFGGANVKSSSAADNALIVAGS